MSVGTSNEEFVEYIVHKLETGLHNVNAITEVLEMHSKGYQMGNMYRLGTGGTRLQGLDPSGRSRIM